MLKKYRHMHIPKLKEINGFLNLSVISFGWFFLALGASLYIQSASTTDFFVINDLFTYQFWGISFLVGGLSLLIGHLMNWWAQMRYTILFLLFTQFVWISALTVRQVQEPNSNIFLLLFFALALILQIGSYIYFPIFKKAETWKL